MFAAAGNHVTALKRISIGGLRLPEDLEEGDWRELTADELAAVFRTQDQGAAGSDPPSP
jgi:16S rRNA pseudouridine516 synthase